MQMFNTLADAQAAVRAVPGFIPPLVFTGEGHSDVTDNQDGTKTIKRKEYWQYEQEVGDGHTFRGRRCILMQIYSVDAEGTQTLQSVGLSLPVISETYEGFERVVNMPAGPQPIEYQLSSCAFEMPTDADVSAYNAETNAAAKAALLPRGCIAFTGTGAAADTNPIVSYHHYQIPSNLNLESIAAEWDSLPRFTEIQTETGFYLNQNNQSTWYRMGGFTSSDIGITLYGTNPTPTQMPPGGIYASATLVPQLPIKMSNGTPLIGSDGIPEIDYAVAAGDTANLMNGTAAIFPLFLRIKVFRTRACFRDAQNAEIRPYIDIDWNMTRKKA